VAEAILYTEEVDLKQQQTSDIYSKNGMDPAEQAKEAKEEGTEAEKNQERLNNVSGRMTEADMAKLQSEGFPVDEMTAEQLEAAMERIKLQQELAAGALEGQVAQIEAQRAAVIEQAIKHLAGNPKAEMIAEKLLRSNLPVTQANLEKVAVALEKAAGGVKLTPTECNNVFIIIERPENPPVEILFGSRKIEKAMPIINVPSIIIETSNASCHFLFTLINIIHL
jgi:hypothetical protein